MTIPALFDHQAKVISGALRRPYWGLFLDTGTGKTRIGLELHRLMKSRATLVVCPLTIIEPAWEEDFKRFVTPHDPEAQFINLRRLIPSLRRGGGIPGRVGLGPLCTINYETFRLAADVLAPFQWDLVIFDESSKLKNNRAKVTKTVVAFCDVMRLKKAPPKIFVMSGSPAPNNELEYFPQMRCLSPDVLGRSFYAFRNTYFQPAGYMGHQWRLLKGKGAELQERMKKHAIYIKKEDCLDLPEQLDQVLHVPMNVEQARAYRTMVNDLISSMSDGSLALAQNTAVRAMKLRQITSGFLRPDIGVDDAGEYVFQAPVLTWLSEAKLKALEELAEETAPKRLLVWVNFHAETDAILALLKKHGTVEQITGRTPVKDRPGVVQRFRSGETRFLVAHPRAAGHGLTLVECDLACYFSLSYSWEDYKQSRDRLHRAGQRHAVTYIHLVAPGTIDEDILRALRRKEDAAEAVLAGLKQFASK